MCEYDKMENPENQLIRDRFVFGLDNSTLREELLFHRNAEGKVVTLEEIVSKARACEAATLTNAKVMERRTTEEQVNFTKKLSGPQSSPWRRNASNTRSNQGNAGRQHSDKPYCGYCGANEWHTRKSCPAGIRGVYCSNCYGRNHFSKVCRGVKDKYKDQWLQAQKEGNEQGRHGRQVHQVQQEAAAAYDEEDRSAFTYAFALDVNAVDKLYTRLPLSLDGDKFTHVPLQIDTAASCNTMPLATYMKIGLKCDLQPSFATLISP